MKRHHGLIIVAVIAFVISAGYNIMQYQNLVQLTIESQQLHEANEDFQALFASVLTLDNGTITHRFTANGTVERGSVSDPMGGGMSYETFPVPYNLYNLLPNATLEVSLQLSSIPPDAYIPVRIWWYQTLHPSQAVNNTIHLPEDQVQTYCTTLFTANASVSSTYTIPLPARGWYVVYVHAPSGIENRAIPYTITLTVLDEGEDSAFIVLPRIILITP